MNENSEEPFVCLEVDENSSISSLTKKFDEFFPNKMVRLKIKGDYSSFFYVGGGKWLFKPKVKKRNLFLKAKITPAIDIEDLIDEKTISLIEYLGIDTKKLSKVEELKILGENISGMFFKNNSYYIIDQRLICKADDVIKLFIEKFNFEIVFDLTNSCNSGFIILKSNFDFFR